jgi:hypothetical protein
MTEKLAKPVMYHRAVGELDIVSPLTDDKKTARLCVPLLSHHDLLLLRCVGAHLKNVQSNHTHCISGN